MVGPSSVTSPGLIPGRFMIGTTAPLMTGNCTKLFLAISSGISGMSVAPKVTVLAVICLMPPPEPID